MSTENKEEAIFDATIQLKTQAEREAYLAGACGNNKDLRAKVEALLKYHDAGGFIDDPVVDAHVTLGDSPLTEGPGTVIGKYKILEKIGEGGMACVYMAEQKEPVRRKVALKIIKLGMDTKQVIARFEVERQALAMMDHPNIAKVLDAGATDTGRPYFVMELVKGVPLTEFCDMNDLSTRSRLDLFIPICQAIQHAHQKGIIHRDIKPTNIMITLHDDTPVPKVIDFGIAKATNQQLTEKTLFTRYAQMIGTPEYMSPEQAAMSGLDIDTRTDIYSLGVLLYELLTGTTPLDAKTLRRVGYAEIQRIIKEEEPTKPSTKLSTLGEDLTIIAKQRSTQPEALRKLIKGDLDWVVMKALEKNRIRRYPTAAELAADIERHINHEPVSAAAPSITYKLSKFTRRNRSLVASAAVVFIVLAAGIVSSASFALWANSERLKTEEARSALADQIIETTNLKDTAQANLLKSEKSMELVTKTIGFLPTVDSGKSLSPTFDVLDDLPTIYNENGEAEDYRQLLLECYVEQAAFLQNGQTDLAQQKLHDALNLANYLKVLFPAISECRLLPVLIRLDIGSVLIKAGQTPQGEMYYQQAQSMAEAFIESGHDEDYTKYKSSLAQNYYDLALTLWKGNQHEHWASDQYLIKALNIQMKLVSASSESTEYRDQQDKIASKAIEWASLRLRYWIGFEYDPAGAHNLCQLAVKANPTSARYLSLLSSALYRTDQFEAAIKAAETSRKFGGYEHFNFLILAMCHLKLDNIKEAKDCYEKASVWKEKNPTYIENFYRICAEVEVLLGIPESQVKYPNNYITWQNRGCVLAKSGDMDQAIFAFEKAVELDNDTLWNWSMLATAYLGNNEITKHSQTCDEILGRFGNTQTFSTARLVAYICKFSQNATEDWNLPLELTRKGYKGLTNPKHVDFNSALGHFLYRNGQYIDALEILNIAVTAWVKTGIPRMDTPSYTLFFLAMTHEKLGNHDMAEKWLTKAINQSEKDMQERYLWLISVYINQLQQEAELLILGKTTGRQEKP